MNYVKLIFDLKTPDDGDILAAFLSSMNVQGFEEYDRSLFVFFNEEEYNEAEVKELVAPMSYTFQTEIIPHENWNSQWESNFQPIRISNEVGVRADFHPPFTDCKYDIIITPKMSFGTGHHETTQMMLEFESETPFENKSVLDFGCGTGLLAIFARLKGGNHVIGIDNDEWSMENAKENCLRNQCQDIVISPQDLQTIDGKFDFVLANINLNVLLESFGKMKELLDSGGQIFLSGILLSDIPAISKCFTDLGFELIAQKQKKDWVALHVKLA